jgi:hypothetical protein
MLNLLIPKRKAIKGKIKDLWHKLENLVHAKSIDYYGFADRYTKIFISLKVGVVMHVDEIWVEKQDDDEIDASQLDAIRLLEYLENDEWLVEYGSWDNEDRLFTGDMDFMDQTIVEMKQSGKIEEEDDVDELFEEDEFQDIISGSEIFKDYTKVQ